MMVLIVFYTKQFYLFRNCPENFKYMRYFFFLVGAGWDLENREGLLAQKITKRK